MSIIADDPTPDDLPDEATTETMWQVYSRVHDLGEALKRLAPEFVAFLAKLAYRHATSAPPQKMTRSAIRLSGSRTAIRLEKHDRKVDRAAGRGGRGRGARRRKGPSSHE